MNSFSARAMKKPRVAEPPPALSRSERHKAEKLERIKREARRLFGRKGFARASISEIARAADVGVGTVFLYAASKEQLLVMCFRDEVGSAIDEGFRGVPRRAALLEQVMHVFEVMIEHNRSNLELARVFTREIPFASDDPHRGVKEVMERFYRQMEALITQAQKRGELRYEVPAAGLAHNLFALYFNFLLRWLGREHRSHEPQTPALKAALDLQLMGLRQDFRTSSRTRRSHEAARLRKRREVR
jgi:AcrR family transcriptional regulator